MQVLAPMYGRARPAVENQYSIQHADAFSNPAVKRSGGFLTWVLCQYRDGGKVIHLVNDAESNVFNGSGYITDLLQENIQNPSKMN